MIREATTKDYRAMMDLIKEFIDEIKSYGQWNEELISTLVVNAMTNDDAIAIVSETNGKVTGVLVGVIAPHPMFGYKVASELVWRMSKDTRGGVSAIKLLQAFIHWAKDNKAEFVNVMDVPEVTSLGKMYNRLGFGLAERTFVGKLK